MSDKKNIISVQIEEEDNTDKKKNVLSGIVIITLGIFLLLYGIILKVPHVLKNNSLTKSIYGKNNTEITSLYKYEHEKFGDTVLRNAISDVKIFTGVFIITVGIIFIFRKSFKEQKMFKYLYKFLYIFTIILSCLIFIGILFIILYMTGSLNNISKSITLKYESKQKNIMCAMRGKEIIFNHCAKDKINEIYTMCINDIDINNKTIMDRLKEKCRAQITEYNNNKKNKNNINTDILSAEEFDFYQQKEMNINDRNKEFESKNGGYVEGYIPLTFGCEYIVHILFENSGAKNICQNKAYNDYIENNKEHYDNCTKKSQNQAIFNKDNLFSEGKPDGYTWSTCEDEVKYKKIKTLNLQPNIDEDIKDKPINYTV